MKVTPLIQSNIYYGTSDVPPAICDGRGLPSKGTDIDLVRHAEPLPSALEKSAFIGTCPFPQAPGYSAGALFWAGEDGWVYHIDKWPGYHLSILDGHIPDGKGGFRGILHVGELETAIPAPVPMSNIVKIGAVVRLRRGLAIEWGAQ